MPKVNFTLNGQAASVTYEPGMHFLEVLREECGIVSAKNGCAPEGACGCCAILVDGQPVLACLRKPEQMEGHDVVTLEGMPEEMRRVLGEAFLLEGGVQCGFCIPGILVRASSLLRNKAAPTIARPSPRRSTVICAAAPATRGSSTPFKPPAKPGTTASSFRSQEPRRHSYFGEEFGLSRQSRAPTAMHEERHRPIHFALSRDRPGAGRKAFRRRHARSRNAACRCRA